MSKYKRHLVAGGGNTGYFIYTDKKVFDKEEIIELLDELESCDLCDETAEYRQCQRCMNDTFVGSHTDKEYRKLEGALDYFRKESDNYKLRHSLGQKELRALRECILAMENDQACLPEDISVTEYVTALQWRVKRLFAAWYECPEDSVPDILQNTFVDLEGDDDLTTPK